MFIVIGLGRQMSLLRDRRKQLFTDIMYWIEIESKLSSMATSGTEVPV